MKSRVPRRGKRAGRAPAWLSVLLALGLAVPIPCRIQAQAQAQAAPSFGQEEIEQLVAPIALYPDALVAQILMASTYPLEVVEAARWVKANPKVTGAALETAMQGQGWDASVKSLTAFPQVLDMMDQKLDSTTKLGEAFLAQQADVMAAIQRLRARAKAAGNLESNEQQKVIIEQAAPAAGSGGAAAPAQTIIIQPANPQVVYVPTYNPTVVYGAWPYPAYPPYYYYPPGYTAMASVLSFGVGLAVGSALWGGCNWGRGDVDINVNNYNNYNRTNISDNKWSHNVEHRKGVGYRDQNLRNQYGNKDLAKNAQSRDAFRGRAEQGQRDIASGKVDGIGGRDAGGRGDAGRGSVGKGGMSTKPGDGGRPGAGSGGSRQPANARRDSASTGRQPAAFGGVGNGNDVRRDSARGQESRNQARSYGGGGGPSGGGGARGGYSGGGGGGGGRGGGGGGRGGGGGGRGGGGRR